MAGNRSTQMRGIYLTHFCADLTEQLAFSSLQRKLPTGAVRTEPSTLQCGEELGRLELAFTKAVNSVF